MRAWVAIVAAVVALRLLGAFTVGVVTSGSMEPTLPAGSVFLAIAGRVEPGDVVVYRAPDGALVVHRAVAEAYGGWVTKGDANALTDQAQGVPAARPMGVVPEVAGRPLAVRQSAFAPAALVVAETALLGFGLKGVLDERRRRGRPLPVRPHHLVALAAAVLLVAAPFFHDRVEARGQVTVGASLLPTVVRVEDASSATTAFLAPFATATVEARGEADVVRAPAVPGAARLAEYGAVAATVPAALVLGVVALGLRWSGC